MKQLGLLIILAVIFSLSLFSQGNGTYHQFDLEVDGLTREYTLYVPEGHDGTEAWPLVFNFHMLNSNIDNQIKISEMYLVADTAKFLIVYPKGLPVLFRPYAEYGTVLGWNIPDLNVADQDDISFVREIVKDISDNPSYMIDQRRIHATGISSGGVLSCFLAFNLSEIIASVASVASIITDTLVNYICSPVRQISVLHIYGTEDPSIPANGWTEWGIFPLMGETDYWSNVNGCNAIPDSSQLEDVDQNDNSTVTLFDYNGCDQETEVKLYRINGGGHTWPSGWTDPSWGLGTLNKDINASAEIWNFFKRNPHPNPWVEIPDTAFLYALIDEGVDTNGDSLISYEEAEAITYLDVGGELVGAITSCTFLGEISNLKGLEAFINLDSLNIQGNKVDSIDLSMNKALRYFNCCSNILSNLDVSNNTALTSLYCGCRRLCIDGFFGNQLTSLDVSNNTALAELNCSGNQLTSLDISRNTALEQLWIQDMPTLYEVCVWENFFSDSSDIYINTDRSFNVCLQADCNGDCSVVGINDFQESKISIYPNPTYTLLTIETVTSDKINIEITSLNGQLIFSKELEGTTHQIDLSSFQKGVYFITIRSKDFVTTRKIVKL